MERPANKSTLAAASLGGGAGAGFGAGSRRPSRRLKLPLGTDVGAAGEGRSMSKEELGATEKGLHINYNKL